MKKTIILSGLVGVAALTGCKGINTDSRDSFLQKWEELGGAEGAPGWVSVQDVNGEKRVNGQITYTDDYGVKYRRVHREYGDYCIDTIIVADNNRSEPVKLTTEEASKEPNRGQIEMVNGKVISVGFENEASKLKREQAKQQQAARERE